MSVDKQKRASFAVFCLHDITLEFVHDEFRNLQDAEPHRDRFVQRDLAAGTPNCHQVGICYLALPVRRLADGFRQCSRIRNEMDVRPMPNLLHSLAESGVCL